MSTVRKFTTIIMAFVLLLALFTAASANNTMNTKEAAIVPYINPYEYGTSPEHLYAFLYRGYAPYFSVSINTSTCIEGRLYVYDAELNRVTEICSQQISAYTCTQDALFFVTSTQQVFKTDYTGQNIEFLYQCELGSIDSFDNYLDTLYFIEAGERVVFLNYNTRTAQTVWIYSDLMWIFLLSPTELVAATMEEEHYLLNITTGEVLLIGNGKANELITEAIIAASKTSNPEISLMAFYSPSIETQENDISFPLTEYPVNLGNNTTYYNYTYTDPISWFHKNGLEGCNGGDNCKKYTKTGECEGFARYAHDVYLHNVAPEGTEYQTWFTAYPRNGRFDFDDQEHVEDFFDSLNTGDYVRYGNDANDEDPEDGIHSIVFVGRDDYGIWVYECNQNYYNDLEDPDRLDDHPAGDYGCGIHLQYYPYRLIRDRYPTIVYYIKHNYNESPVYDDTTYHKVGCSHCVGYLRQEHDDVSATILKPFNHRATFNCCSGSTVTTAHTATVMYSVYSATQHKISAACCSGYLLENHTFALNSNNRYVCTGCGQFKDMIIMSLEQKPVSM